MRLSPALPFSVTARRQLKPTSRNRPIYTWKCRERETATVADNRPIWNCFVHDKAGRRGALPFLDAELANRRAEPRRCHPAGPIRSRGLGAEDAKSARSSVTRCIRAAGTASSMACPATSRTRRLTASSGTAQPRRERRRILRDRVTTSRRRLRAARARPMLPRRATRRCTDSRPRQR